MLFLYNDEMCQNDEPSPDSMSMSELSLGLRRVFFLGFGDERFSWGRFLQLSPCCQQEKKQ